MKKQPTNDDVEGVLDSIEAFWTLDEFMAWGQIPYERYDYLRAAVDLLIKEGLMRTVGVDSFNRPLYRLTAEGHSEAAFMRLKAAMDAASNPTPTVDSDPI